MLTFAVLGEVRGWRGEDELDLGAKQRRAVFALLLLRPGRAASIEEIIDGVWGQDPTPSAVGALRNHILHLRKVLEPGRSAGASPMVLVGIGGGYALRVPPDAVDIERVEHIASDVRSRNDCSVESMREALDAALDHWTGTPLTGLPGPFAARQRSHLVERRLALLEQRIELDVRLGRYDEAITELTPLCADYPLRESLRALLMTALYHTGRQADALSVYADTRDELIEALGIEPGEQLVQLHQRILRGNLTATPRVPESLEVWERPRAAQLPATVADFTGREHEVALLRSRLTSGAGVPVCAIGGMGGIGKSALAIHVAHQVRGEFPDGQLHADLRGFATSTHSDMPTATATDTLGDFLRALGVPEGELASAVAERSAQFRSLLDGKRVLVVLDNAREVGQISPLIPGTAGSAVLVTSRSALLELPGTTSVRLDVLPAAEAHGLLVSMVGAARLAAEPEATAQLLTVCGGLPLAVRIVGARLAARPAWTVRTIADRLHDAQRRLSLLRTGELAVESAFGVSYDQLDSVHARAFRLLAIPDVGEISPADASAILLVDVVEAEQICEALVDVHLLETTRPGRYTYHDLLRLYARDLVVGADETESTVLHRLLDFYLATVKNVLVVCNPGTRLPEHLVASGPGGLSFDGPASAAAWLTGHRLDLIAMYEQSAQVGGHALATAADLAWATAELIDGGAHCQELARALGSLLDVVLRTGDRPMECRVRAALGATLTYSLGALREGRDHQRIALSLDRGSAGDARLIAFAAQLLASSTRSGTETAAPLAHSARAIRLARQVGDRALEGTCLVHDAKTLSDAGDYVGAGQRATGAKALAAQLGNRSLEAMATHELGVTLAFLGRTAEGVRMCEDAVRLAELGGIEIRLGWALARLSHVLLMNGESERAAAIVGDAIEVLTRATGPLIRARVLVLQGVIEHSLGLSATAEATLRSAAEAFASMDGADLTRERIDAGLEAPVLLILREHLDELLAQRS